MLSVDEALGRILAQVESLPAEKLPILDALGQVLAEDITSTFNIPPYDNVAMDGYAVQEPDIAGASRDAPRNLRVIGELPAGLAPQQSVEPGTAIRVMTGAPLPPGADTVVPFESTSEYVSSGKRASLDTIQVFDSSPAGANVRRAGEDIQAGAVILAKGTELRPADIGVLASLGLPMVKVHRRPRVAILSTGNELLPPGEPLVPGKIYDSNTYSLAALVKRYGGLPVVLGIARDEIEDLRQKVRAGLEADLLLTSAGVSKGDYDIVKDVLAAEGKVEFWQVAIKPGRPMAFGVLPRKDGGVPHIGLPGNPVASMVAFEQFVRPAILKMMGKRNLRKPEVEAIFHGRYPNGDHRRCYARVRVVEENGELHAYSTGPQGSGILTSMAYANGLAVVPESLSMAEDGVRLKVQMLDDDFRFWILDFGLRPVGERARVQR